MRCPQCGYEQLPEDVCSRCGTVFFKYNEIQKRKAEKLSLKETPDTPGATTSPPEEPSASTSASDELCRSDLPWNPVSLPAMISLSLGFFVVLYLLAVVDRRGEGSLVLFMIHNVNLVFHEAGHWIFGVLGNDTLMILGGSLNQVLIPLIVSVAFWRRRDAVGFAFGLFWMCENFIDVAVYMADARALELQLIGGLGEESHDWRNLFLRWNLLAKDTLIARYVDHIGWFGMCSVWGWLVWRWFARPGERE